MENFFEHSRYFFNEVLPVIISERLYELSIILQKLWWLFLLLSFILFLLVVKIFRLYVVQKGLFEKFDEFYTQFFSYDELGRVEDLLLEESKNFIHAKYSVLYKLQDEIFLLVAKSKEIGDDVEIPFRIGKRELEEWRTSGKYYVYGVEYQKEGYLLLFFSRKKIDIERFKGHFTAMMAHYAFLKKGVVESKKEIFTKVAQETALSLVKLNMDAQQFFQFLIYALMEVGDAQGMCLLTKDGKLIFEIIKDKSAPLQKVFYIRNTPYKLEYYAHKSLDKEQLMQIGTFLDLAGNHLVTIDKNSQIIQNYIELLKFINQAVELKSPFYKNHSLLVQTVALEVAKALFVSQEELEYIALGAFLHDIGMVGNMLVFVEKKELSQEDIDVIHKHPLIGAIMVEPIAHIYPILDMIKYHHERYDGKGYPFGLKGSAIPQNGYIVALAEFYVGLTSDRPYRKGKSHEEAIEEIKKGTNKLFDEAVVDAFLDVEKSIKVKIEKIRKQDGI